MKEKLEIFIDDERYPEIVIRGKYESKHDFIRRASLIIWLSLWGLWEAKDKRGEPLQSYDVRLIVHLDKQVGALVNSMRCFFEKKLKSGEITEILLQTKNKEYVNNVITHILQSGN